MPNLVIETENGYKSYTGLDGIEVTEENGTVTIKTSDTTYGENPKERNKTIKLTQDDAPATVKLMDWDDKVLKEFKLRKQARQIDAKRVYGNSGMEA